jgi:zinc protease
MSERNGLRYGLLGLALLVLLALLALIIPRPNSAPAPLASADPDKLESLAALGDQAPSRRDLNIQSWQTAEGAKVLFVEARELPMFDLQLTFAAGSSHDDGLAGLASLTNAMLNEGVQGKDVNAIAAGFEDLGANFGNGAFRDMAIASLRSLAARACDGDKSLHSAPHFAPRRRLDETQAARKPILVWKGEPAPAGAPSLTEKGDR